METTPGFRWYVVADRVDALRVALNAAPTDVILFDQTDGTFGCLSPSCLVYVAAMPEFIIRLDASYYWTGTDIVSDRAHAKRYQTRQEADRAMLRLPVFVYRSCVSIDEV